MKPTSSLHKIFRFLDRFQWLLLLIAAPFLLFPSPLRTLALLLLPLGWLAAWIARREPLPPTPFNLVMFLMALMVLVSLWATYDPLLSLPKITGMLLAFAVFFAFTRYGRIPLGWILCLGVFILAGLGTTGLSLVGTKWYAGKIGVLNTIIALLPRGLFNLSGAQQGFHPNEVAGALLWIIPPLLVVTVALTLRLLPKPQKSPAKLSVWFWLLVCILLTGFMLGIFILTKSRAAYLSLLLSLPVLLWLALPTRWRLLLLGMFIALTLLTIGFSLRSGTGVIWSAVFNQSLPSDPLFSLNSLGGRMEIWSRALYAIHDFPLTGLGMNTFRRLVHILYPTFLVGPETDFGHAHNEFLQAALDLGLPGLVAFLALNLMAFVLWIVLLKRTKNRAADSLPGFAAIPLYAIVLGLGGGLLAHLLFGLVDAVALGSKPGILFWMILGLVASLYEKPPELPGLS